MQHCKQGNVAVSKRTACPSVVSQRQDAHWSATTTLCEPDRAWVLCLGKEATGVGLKRYAKVHLWLIDDSDTHPTASARMPHTG